MRAIIIILTVGGCIMLPLLWTIQVWRKLNAFKKHLERESCKMCGKSFAESIYQIEGPIRGADRAKLDKFQLQFAAYRVRCTECESINLCATNGTPMICYPA